MCLRVLKQPVYTVKCGHIGVFSGPNARKYGPEKTTYLDSFHAVLLIKVNVADKTNRKDISSVDLGFGIKYELKRLIYIKKATSMQVLQFKKKR